MYDFDNIYITGDKHADFEDLILQSVRYGFTDRDLLIILGDVGINFYADIRDTMHKDVLSQIPSTILCIRGNHEMRPTDSRIADKFRKIKWQGDTAYVEEEYPRFIMAADGARYRVNGREFLVIGGAYSIDKYWRIQNGYPWFDDEQLSEQEMERIKQSISVHGNREDIILAHTCPYNDRPVECFISGFGESEIDNTMEHFLQDIADSVTYNALYCGHWHTDKRTGKIHFLFHDIVVVENGDE